MLFAAALLTFATGGASRTSASAPDSLVTPGVTAALARYRAAQIRDVRYDLSLDVTRTDTAAGRVTIRFTRRLGAEGDVILDFRGASLARMRVNGTVQRGVDYTGQHIRIPARALAADTNRVDIEFSSLIAAAGASIIRVRDPSDGATYLYTLLVPSDAQQLFPCFDQPDLKARVTLTLTTPIGWRAVSNGEQLRTDTSSRGTTFVFRETEPLSTYLIAFAAGPWATRSIAGTSRPITLYVRQSRATEVEADSILRDTDRAVNWLERYFAVPYAFNKLDVLLAPAFPFGGMEHPGAIFFSEERFIYREPPTLPQRLGRTATVYHEVAHQWFGDLVTMHWFDDLWLKEGFATYMAAKMQAALDPSSDAWKTFYLRNKPQAYAVDVTAGTTSVWQPLGNLDQAKSNYGAIVYNKAPGVLKQLNYLVGDDAFQRGLRAFIRAHAFGNATWRDLISSIGAAAGQPLRWWGEDYITRPGMPVLTPILEVRNGRVGRLRIVQRPARTFSGTRPWPIKTELLLVPRQGTPTRLPVDVSAETTTVAAAAGLPAPAWMFANAGDNAYALTLLDSASISWLERSLGDVSNDFQRAMLWGALWDEVREAVLSPERFVMLVLRQLPREPDEQVVSAVLGHLTRTLSAYLTEGRRAAIQPAVERFLAQAIQDGTRSYGVRRAHLDALVRVAATPQALSAIAGMLDSAKVAGIPIGPPTRWSIVTRLVAREAPGAERRLLEETQKDRSAEGARRAFVANAARGNAIVKREYFTRYFADSALNEDWATASLDAFNAPESRMITLPYLRPALDSLPWIQRNRRIFYLGSWITSFMEGQVDEAAIDVVRRFLVAREDLPRDLRLKVLQSADELERTVRIRKTFGD